MNSTKLCSFLNGAYQEVKHMLKFICYPKCTTCQKAQKWLDDNNIKYELRDIKHNNPTFEELTQWHKKSGLSLKKFFNTSGLLYKSMELKTKLPNMTEDEMLKEDIDMFIEELAKAVIRGEYGNGQERKKKLGNLYNEVQKRVNEILKGK